MGLAQTYLSSKIVHEATGVTYHFAQPVEYGFYANGEIFVVSDGRDITITRIEPEDGAGGRTQHGTVVQPRDASAESFDSALSGYKDAYNVDPSNTGSPLVIDAGDYPQGASVVKAVSLSGKDGFTWIEKFSVLTVVPETPPEGAFRPPIVGDDKTSYHTLDDLDFSKLQSLPEIEGQRSLDFFDDYHGATFVSWRDGGAGTRDMHPNAYHKGYGDYQADEYADALMALHGDAPNAQKQDLYVALVQAGIDYAAGADAGFSYSPQSAHNDEYKVPTVLAAVALNSPELAEAASREGAFREDQWVNYITAEDVGTDYHYVSAKNFAPGTGSVYQDVQIGLPEWQLKSRPDPSLDAGYRIIHWDQVPPTALAIEMLGNGEGRTVWNNEAYFDYAARLKAIFDVDPVPFGSGAHAATPAQMAFLDRYFDTYSASADLAFRPEAPLGLDITANGANLDVALTGPVLKGTGSVTRVDVRYSTDGETWTVIEDFGMSGRISNLAGETAYYVQARYVSDVGPGPWINNDVEPDNDDLINALIDAGIVSQRDIDAAGGLGSFMKTAAYENHVDKLVGLAPGYESAADNFVVGVAVTGMERLEGTAFDDVINGGGGNQVLRGYAGDDVLNGGPGDSDTADYSQDLQSLGAQGGITADLGTGIMTDPYGDTDTLIDIEAIIGSPFADRIVGTAANDTIEGGAGWDTAVWTADHTSMSVSISASGLVVDDRREDELGTDTVNGVETLSFADRDWHADSLVGATALSEADFRSLVDLYIASFDRAPDAEGLFFWGAALADGTLLEEAARTFLNSDEYKASYTAGSSNEDFIREVYANVLGRAPDPMGSDFWVAELESGDITRDLFILEVLRGTRADGSPPKGASPAFTDQQRADRQHLDDKTDIGIYFAAIKGLSNVARAADAMAIYDGSEDSLTAAATAIDAFHAAAVAPASGEFLVSLVGVIDDPFEI